MSELPPGWVATNLESLAEFVMGQAPPGSASNFDGKGTPFVKAGEFGFERPEIREWTTKPLKMAREGDVLICVVGATCGKLNLGADCAIGRSVAAIRPHDGLDQHYLYARLKLLVSSLRSAATGSAQGVIAKEQLAEIELALPPLAEQRRIVAKLDVLTGRTARARADLDRVPALGARYKQAVLAGAMQGRLFRDRRAAMPVKAVPLKSALSRLRTGPFGSALHKHEYVDGGVPLINPMHINDGLLTPSANMSVTAAKAEELSDFRLSPGDVVIARRGVMGRCAVANAEHSGWLIGTGSMAISPGPALDPEYLQLFLSSPDVVAALEEHAVGTTMVNLNQGVLLRLEIRLPDRVGQQRIVDQVKVAFAEIDRLVAEAAAARRLLDRLDQAILAKAFRGELVPQDPADEPASALLERIRTERAAAPARSARGRRVKAAA